MVSAASGPSRIPYPASPAPLAGPLAPAGAGTKIDTPVQAAQDVTPTVLPGQSNGVNLGNHGDSTFHPDGFKMPAVSRGGPPPNGSEMAESLMKIVEALKTLQPESNDGIFSGVLDKLGKITHQLGKMAQPTQAASAAESQPAPEEAGVPSDPPSAAATQPDMAPASTDPEPATEGPDETSTEPEAGPEDVSDESPEAEVSTEGSSDQTDPPPKPETEGAAESGHPGEQGVANSEANPVKAPQAETASETLARMKEKNVQRLLENLLGREMYKQLCQALEQQH